MQRPQFLFGDLAALKEVTDVAHHPRPFRQVAQEAAGIQLIDKMRQKTIKFALRGDHRLVGHQRARRSAIAGRPPLVRHHHDGLCQVQRHKRGIERIAHQGVGVGHVVVVQTGPLRSEQQTGAQTAGADLPQFGRGAAGGQHRFDDVARARAGGKDVVQVGGSVGDGFMHCRGIENTIGAGGRSPRLLLRPAIPRRDEAHVEQAAVRHGPGTGADVVGELRPHQDHHRAVADRVQIGAPVPSGHLRGLVSALTRSLAGAFHSCACQLTFDASPRRSAVGAVLKHDALRRQLRPNRVRAGEVAGFPGGEAFGDRGLDRASQCQRASAVTECVARGGG